MALVAALGAIIAAGSPLLPVILLFGISETLAALALLVLLLVQDAALVTAALLFASLKRRPRPWQFGIRATRLWPTLAWAVLGFGALIGFELGYIELLDVEQSDDEDLETTNTAAAFLVALAVIVVAPVTEEFFFRAFFYRALRTRLRVWSAALIDGAVFGALHFQGPDSAVILPVIAVVGAGLCLVYERTGSLFAVIAIHAAFNTFATLGIAPLPAIVIGSLVLLACLVSPSLAGRRPSPVPA